MAKVYTYIVILSGLMVLLAYAGIPTGSGLILSNLNIINAPQDFSSSTFAQSVSAILAIIALSTIIIGFITKGQSETFIVAGFATLLFSFIADAYSIIVYANGTLGQTWVTALITLILGPLIIGYGVAIIEWWRGSD